MKNIFLITLMLFFMTANAQYESIFRNDTTQWKVHFTNYDNLLINYELANNKLYSDFPISDLNDSIPIRKNACNSKVWITPNATNKEILVFDLDLNVNDSFKVYEYSNLINMDSSYLTVDSVYTLLGKKIISFSNSDLRFIEGIGPSFFFLYGYDSEPLSLLICKTELGILEYHIDAIFGYKNCEIYTGVIDLLNKANYSFNTIIDDLFRLETNFNGTLKAELYNSIGLKINEFKFNNQCNRDYSNLLTGIYYLKISNAHNSKTIKLIRK